MIGHTSSIHTSESRVIFALISYPNFCCFTSLGILSIRVAYFITDSVNLFV